MERGAGLQEQGLGRVPRHANGRRHRPAGTRSPSAGKASRSCCATQPAVGLVVTAQRTKSRRPWRESIAAMPPRWFRRKVVQVGLALGVRGRERRYRMTLRSETSKPRHSNSPWMRGAPQGFSDAILWMSARTRSRRERMAERSAGRRATRRPSIEPGTFQILGRIINDSSADGVLARHRPPVARAQAPPDFSELGPSYDGADRRRRLNPESTPPSSVRSGLSWCRSPAPFRCGRTRSDLPGPSHTVSATAATRLERRFELPTRRRHAAQSVSPDDAPSRT
jgi:hypothetical protein